MISNTYCNNMGTVSFDGLFDGMRKPQDFVVYPMHGDAAATLATIQSGTRIGTVDLMTGAVKLSPARSGGSYGVHMVLAKPAGALSGEELLILKAQIAATASGRAGTNGAVYTDNSGAANVFRGGE